MRTRDKKFSCPQLQSWPQGEPDPGNGARSQPKAPAPPAPERRRWGPGEPQPPLTLSLPRSSWGQCRGVAEHGEPQHSMGDVKESLAAGSGQHGPWRCCHSSSQRAAPGPPRHCRCCGILCSLRASAREVGTEPAGGDAAGARAEVTAAVAPVSLSAFARLSRLLSQVLPFPVSWIPWTAWAPPHAQAPPAGLAPLSALAPRHLRACSIPRAGCCGIPPPDPGGYGTGALQARPSVPALAWLGCAQ